MATSYTYSLSTDFAGGLNSQQLQDDINAGAGLANPCFYVENTNVAVDDVIIHFTGPIDNGALGTWISGSYTFALDPILDIVPGGSDDTTTILTSSQTIDLTLTLPNPTGDDNLVSRTSTDTLTNKTMDTANNTFTLDAADITTGTLLVARGGTGAGTFVNNRVLTGNGTSALVDEANLTFDGSSLTVNNNVLTDNLDARTATTLTIGGATATAVTIGEASMAGDVNIDTAGNLTVDATGTGASNITVTGADAGAGDFTVKTVEGSLILEGGEDAPDAIQIYASSPSVGGVSISGQSLGANMDSTITMAAGGKHTISSASSAGIEITASNANGIIDINSGTNGGITIDAGSSVSIDANATSNFTTSSSSLTISATGGDANAKIIIDSNGTAADAIKINASDAAGGIDIDAGTNGINIATTGTTAGALTLTATGAAGGITIQPNATGNITLGRSGNTMLWPTTAGSSGQALLSGGAGANMTLASIALQMFDAIVATSGGDYTTLSAALTAGAKSIFIRSGNYVETGDVNVDTSGVFILGESLNDSVIDFNGGAFSLKVDGGGPAAYVTGTVSIANGGTTVTGSSTLFTVFGSGAQTNTFIIIEQNAYPVTTITNDTTLTIGIAFNGRTIAASPGAKYILRKFISHVTMSNFTIIDSIAPGLLVEGVRHSIFTGIICRNNTTNFQVAHNINNNYYSCMSQNSGGVGFNVTSSVSCNFTDCQSFNSAGNGYNVDGSSAICKNLVFNGCQGSNGGADGLFITGADATDISIGECIFNGNVGDGIETASNTGTASFNSCTMDGNGGNGIDMDGSNNALSNCIIGNNGTHGIQAGDGNSITGCQVYNNGSNGVNLNADSEVQVVGNHIYDNTGIGVNIDNINSTVIGNLIHDNGSYGVLLTGSGADNNIIADNRIFGNNSSGVGIFIDDSGATGNTLSANILTANTISNLGTNTTINDWVVNNVSTTTSGTTTITTIPTSTDTTYLIEARVNASQTPTNNSGAAYIICGAFRRAASATVTQIGTTDQVIFEDVAGWNAIFTISGSNILIQVVSTEVELDWRSQHRIQEV